MRRSDFPMKIAVAAGEPAGIGPEVTAKALRRMAGRLRFVVFGGERWSGGMGKPSAESGRIALEAMRQAAEAVSSGEADALVTGPVSKVSLALAGEKLPGATEILGRWFGCETSMALLGGPLRFVLATTHLPLSRVAASLRGSAGRSRLRQVFRHALLLRKLLGEKKPIAVCGLNPHAGDSGLLGKEERNILLPSLSREKKIIGPVPADVAVVRAMRAEYSVLVAMYHDQAMLPLKALSPNRVVNLTLGLPFIRTAPGHGTAFDIAGRGRADPSAMMEAIRWAIRLASLRRSR